MMRYNSSLAYCYFFCASINGHLPNVTCPSPLQKHNLGVAMYHDLILWYTLYVLYFPYYLFRSSILLLSLRATKITCGELFIVQAYAPCTGKNQQTGTSHLRSGTFNFLEKDSINTPYEPILNVPTMLYSWSILRGQKPKVHEWIRVLKKLPIQYSTNTVETRIEEPEL